VSSEQRAASSEERKQKQSVSDLRGAVIVRRPQEHAYLKDNPDAGQECCNGPCNKEQEQYPNDREQNVLAHGLIDLDGLLVNCRFFDETKLPNLFRTRFWRALALALVLSDISDLFQKSCQAKFVAQ
jgi:hypothetical protein